MKSSKKRDLESAGWKVGDTQEFLELSDAEMALVDVRVSLSRDLRHRRRAKKISQATLAKRIGSSQSRVAKMEAGDPSVTIDLLMKTLFRAGSTPAEIGQVIAQAG
ncbi:MAG: helix-turn-helix transcriptional regulator [Gemmatimonadota bacterium]